MNAGPSYFKPLRILFMKSTAYDAHAVATYFTPGWPTAIIAAMFFFQRLFMILWSLPGGLKVEFAPHGDEPETWMSVLA